MRGGQQRRGVGSRRWFTAGLAAAALAGAVVAGTWPRLAGAKPGVVTNRQGQTFAGDVTEDDQFMLVDTAGGQLRIDKRNVARVDYTADVNAQYEQRHAKLAPRDLPGRVELANWATEHSRPDLAATALEEARQIDPANRDVALALDTVQRQMDLDRRHGKTPVPAATPPAVAGAKPVPPATGPAAAGGPPAVADMEHRLLTAAEVNAVRQVEMRTDDRLVKVRLANKVASRYEKASGMTAAAFNQLSGEEQALEILKHGTDEMAKDVLILTDPTPLQLFKTKVMPIVAQGCGSTACHGGPHAGTFMLYTGEGTQQLYTNFYILQTYAAQVGGVKYLAMDREVPDRSLALQYGLPVVAGRPPHPTVAEFRPRFKNKDDPAYQTVYDWLYNSVRVIQPNYGFDVSPYAPPSTQPATTAPAAAAGEPATQPLATTRPTPAHGTPLPRTPSGVVTDPVR